MADQTRLTPPIQVSIRAKSYAGSRTKRAYDLCLAVGLLIATAPVLLPAIVLNTVITGGHPIFVQRRAGKNGVEFGLLKLRTMRPRNGREVWSHRTEVDDKRLTLIGRLLRQTYIDELTQLINVIAGQMSMVGPRPETLETTREISSAHPRFLKRMMIKPGITGVAQVFFRKPASDDDLWRRYYYDNHYITQNSLRFDLAITVLTVWHVLRHKGH